MRNHIIDFIYFLVGSVCAGGSVLGCTDVNLQRLPTHNRITLKGHFCTEDPKMTFLTKVLFVVDASGSIGLTDPSNYRGLAIKQVIEEFQDVDTVSFGLIRFSSWWWPATSPQICTYAGTGCVSDTEPLLSAFTKSNAILGSALTAAANVSGNRPYMSTLDLIYKLIKSDVELDFFQASMTKYMVIFITNGVPCPAEVRNDVLSRMEKLAEFGDDRTAKFAFHTNWLSNTSDPNNCGNGYTAPDILLAMADTANGIYQAFPEPADIDLRELVRNELKSSYELIEVVAENRNARLLISGGTLLAVPDSDGDGLPDEVEEQIGTSPVNPDTDSDGCGDKFEFQRVGFDPLVPGDTATQKHCTCPEKKRKQDSDQDGVLDCEEFFLGSSAHTFDSDEDKLPDGVELRAGLEPAVPNVGFYDADEDGISDIDEVFKQRLPFVNEYKFDQKRADLYDYRYKIEPAGQILDGVQCYNFEVSNISLVETIKSSDEPFHEHGQNDLEINFIEQARENPKSPKIVRFGTFKQFFFEPHHFYPNRSVIFITTEDLGVRR